MPFPHGDLSINQDLIGIVENPVQDRLAVGDEPGGGAVDGLEPSSTRSESSLRMVAEETLPPISAAMALEPTGSAVRM